MSELKDKTEEKVKIEAQTDERAKVYSGEFRGWRDDLKPYYNRFSENYKQYTGFKEQNKGTNSKITDPMAFEFIERLTPRMIDQDPTIIANAHGGEYLSSLTQNGLDVLHKAQATVKGLLEYLWSSPEMAITTGIMKIKLIPQIRELFITGNCFGETYWNITRSVSADKDGNLQGEIICDAPDYRVYPIERLVFNPSLTIKTSDVYYVEKFATYKQLKSQEIRTENGVQTGIYFNLNDLKTERAEKGYVDEEVDLIHRSKDVRRTKKNAPIQILERWEGAKLCVIANGTHIIREEYDPFKLGTHPLILAAEYVVNDEPFGMGEIDPIKEMARAKDTIVNQRIDLINRALKPPMRIDPTLPIKIESLANAYVNGGPVYAAKGAIEYLQPPVLPNEAFMQTQEFQARGEAALDMSGYMGGTPNAASDKTKGTASGTMAMIEQSQPRISMRLSIIEEQIIKPILRNWLKMLSQLMQEGDVKWALISDTTPDVISATKDLLDGKLSLEVEKEGDIDFEEFDISWLIDVETGSTAAINRQEELQNFQQVVQIAQQLNILNMIDAPKLWTAFATKVGIKQPENYISQTPPPNMQPMGPDGQPMPPEGQGIGLGSPIGPEPVVPPTQGLQIVPGVNAPEQTMPIMNQ